MLYKGFSIVAKISTKGTLIDDILGHQIESTNNKQSKG